MPATASFLTIPRTVAQAEALERLLHEKHMELDGVVELKVDENALLRRIEKPGRRNDPRGEPLRKDDNPEVLKTRLEAYRTVAAFVAAAARAVAGLAKIRHRAVTSSIGAMPSTTRNTPYPVLIAQGASGDGRPRGGS